MSDQVNLIAFGTFGNPNGFKQTFFKGDLGLSRYIKTFDLKTDAIKLFPGSVLYSIRREVVNGTNTIAYSVYSYAKEKNSDRGGTFIGSSIMYHGKVSKEHVTLKCLLEFHEGLIKNNVQNDTILVRHSDELVVKMPKDFNNLQFHLKDIDGLSFSNSDGRSLLVYSRVDQEGLNNLLREAVLLLNKFEEVFFTKSSDVAEFVLKRGLIKVTDEEGFGQEVSKYEEEQRIWLQELISSFENEKKVLEEERRKTEAEIKMQIERDEQIHLENERQICEAKRELENRSEKYDELIGKISHLIIRLEKGESPADVKRMFREYHNEFLHSTNTALIKGISKISKPNAKGNGYRRDRMPNFEQNIYSPTIQERVRVVKKNGPFKVISIILFFLWVVTAAYFFFFRESEKMQEVQNEGIYSVPTELEHPSSATKQIEELQPKPNSTLTPNDYARVAKDLKSYTKVENVVEIIFNKNPKDIRKHYGDQGALYAKHLVQLNEGCFEKRGGNYYYIKDSLKNIPSFK